MVRRDEVVVDELLRELEELRELDRRRRGHAPGSPAYQAAAAQVEVRSRRVMDRFRDATRPPPAERGYSGS